MPSLWHLLGGEEAGGAATAAVVAVPPPPAPAPAAAASNTLCGYVKTRLPRTPLPSLSLSRYIQRASVTTHRAALALSDRSLHWGRRHLNKSALSTHTHKKNENQKRKRGYRRLESPLWVSFSRPSCPPTLPNLGGLAISDVGRPITTWLFRLKDQEIKTKYEEGSRRTSPST